MGGGWGRGGRLFEDGRLLTFSSFRIGAYSRWGLIRGWALIRTNTVACKHAHERGKNDGSTAKILLKVVQVSLLAGYYLTANPPIKLTVV